MDRNELTFFIQNRAEYLTQERYRIWYGFGRVAALSCRISQALRGVRRVNVALLLQYVQSLLHGVFVFDKKRPVLAVADMLR